MLTAPIPATQKVLDRAGLAIGDIDLDRDQRGVRLRGARLAAGAQGRLGRPVNVNGGAIALGHPLGASGTRLLATLVCELERVEGRYGLQTMCEGGGLANATIIERV